MNRFVMTLLAGLVIAAPLSAGEKGVKETIAYVQKLQTSTGGFLSRAPAPNIRIAPTLRATSSAVRALHYLGGDVPNKDACIKYVESCYDPKSGGFSDMPKGEPNVFATAVGLMAVVELKMPFDKYADGACKYLRDNAKSFEDVRIAAAGFESAKRKAPKIDHWDKSLADLQNDDGTYGKGLDMPRDTASCIVTRMRLDDTPGDMGTIKVLKNGQRQNGGWGKADSEIASDLETTYRVMRCFVMLKSRPDNVEGVRSFVAKCRNADGGYSVAPGQTSSASGTYFATIILHWLK